MLLELNLNFQEKRRLASDDWPSVTRSGSPKLFIPTSPTGVSRNTLVVYDWATESILWSCSELQEGDVYRSRSSMPARMLGVASILESESLYN